ncbi:pyridoxal phosphate-dependent transferase [Aspergillus similis]
MTAHIGLTNISKNQACTEEYPSITECVAISNYTGAADSEHPASLQHRCVSILANLWNRSDDADPIGTATTGSSEAVTLAGLAMKRRWQEEHPGSDQRPNIIFGSNAHVCVSRFAKYFEVESRIVPVNSASQGVVDSTRAEELIDSKTSKSRDV